MDSFEKIAESIADLQEVMESHSDEIPVDQSKLPTSKADPGWLSNFLGFLQLGSEHLPKCYRLVAEVDQFRDKYVKTGRMERKNK